MEQVFVFVFNITDVCKMDSLCNFRIADDLRKVLVQVTSQGTGTERKSIVNAAI